MSEENKDQPKFGSPEYTEQLVTQHLEALEVINYLNDIVPIINETVSLPKSPPELLDWAVSSVLTEMVDQAYPPELRESIKADIENNIDGLREQITKTDAINQQAIESGISEESLTSIDAIAQVEAELRYIEQVENRLNQDQDKLKFPDNDYKSDLDYETASQTVSTLGLNAQKIIADSIKSSTLLDNLKDNIKNIDDLKAAIIEAAENGYTNELEQLTKVANEIKVKMSEAFEEAVKLDREYPEVPTPEGYDPEGTINPFFNRDLTIQTIQQYGTDELKDFFNKNISEFEFGATADEFIMQQMQSAKELDDAQYAEFLHDNFGGLDGDLLGDAQFNFLNAAIQSEEDRKMHEIEYGEKDYAPDSIVAFENGEPVTYKEHQDKVVALDAEGREVTRRDFNNLTEFEQQDLIKLNENRMIFNDSAESVSSLLKFYVALGEDDDLGLTIAALDALVEMDDLVDRLKLGSILPESFEGTAEDAISFLSSAYGLTQALDDGDDLKAGLYALDLANTIHDALNGAKAGFFDQATGADELPGVKALGQALAIFNLATAIDEGEPLDIINSSYATYAAFYPKSAGLGNLSAGQTAGAFAVGTSLLSGDEFGAALGMLNFLPGGPVIYAVASLMRSQGWLDWLEKDYLEVSDYVDEHEVIPIFHLPALVIYAFKKIAGLFSSPPDPRAWLEFTRNEEGGIDFKAGHNSTGENLAEMLANAGDGFTQYMNVLDEAYAEVLPKGHIEVEALPKLETFMDYGDNENVEWRLLDGRNLEGAVNIIGTNPSGEDIIRALRDVTLIAHENESWKIGEITVTDSVTGLPLHQVQYSPFGVLRPPTYVEAMPVGPRLQAPQKGGFKGVTHAKMDDIMLLPSKPVEPVARELANVQQTWRISKGLFEGENGRLLAMGLAAGLITFDEVALAALPEPAKVSVEDNPVYRSLIEEVKGAYIAAGAGLFGEVEFFDAALSVAPTANFSESINEDYIARRDKLYIEPNLPEVANAAGNEVNSATGVEPLVDRPAVIFSNESTNEPTVSIDDLADDDFVFSAGATANLSAGAGSTFGKIVLPPTPPSSPPPPPGTDELFSLEDREVFSSIDELMANDPEFIAHQAALASGTASATPGVVFVGLGAANNGTVSLWADGTIHFVPDADFHGLAGFSYTIEDASGKQTTHEVQVKVDNVNDRPEAVSDTLTVVEDGRINLKQLLTNDSDTDLDTLNLAAVSSVSAGRIEVDSAGNYFYVADTDYVGEVELTYVVDDGSGDPASRSIAQAVINVTAGANDAPVVQSDVALADGLEDTVYRFNVSDVLVGAYDPEGDDFDVTTMALADDSVGSLTFDSATGEIEYTPRPDFHGEVVFDVEVSDSNGATTNSQARLQIASSVDAISTGDHTLTIVEDAVTLLDPQTFIDGVANPGNEHVEITAVRMVDGEIGQVQLLANGWVQFIPAPEYSGETAFEVRLSNGEDRIVSRVAVDITAVNDAPLVVDDILSGGIEEQVFDFHVDQLLVNDVDAEGDAYEFLSISLDEASQGQLSHDAATGAIQFTPNEDVFGEIGLHYRVVETATGRVSEGVATLLLSNVDDTVDLIDAWRELDEDKPLYYSREQLLSLSHLDANDYKDADGQRLEIVAVRLADGSHGEIELDDQGGVLYQPGVDASDNVELIYTVSDGVSEIEGRIQVQIKPENDAPRTQADAINGALEDTEFVFDSASLLTNDSDPEGDALTVESVKLTDVNAGLLVFDAVDGSVRFTPALNVFGKVGISYTVSDGNNSETQVSEIIVDTSADDFAVVDQVYKLDEDEVRVFTKEELLSDYADSDYKDSDGQDLVMKEVRLLSGATGEVELTGDGEVKFTPEVEMHGTTGFEVLISDGDQGHWQRIDLTITEVNDLPDAQADVLTGAVEEQLFEFKAEQLLANDSDAEGDAYQLTSIKLAQEEAGELIWDEATGKVQYIPALNVFGEVKLTYTLTETVSGRKSEGQAIIEVAGTEDDFVLSDKDYRHKDFNVDEDSVTEFTAAQLLSEYASADASTLDVVDADNQALTITKAHMVDVAQGSVELTSEGNVKFTPAKDFNGLADAEITVTDGVHEHQMAVQLKVWAENDAPNLVEDTRVMDEEGVLTVSEADLLANDVDVDSANFKIVGVWQASGGVARYDADSGVLTYEPDENIYGEALIEYLVADDQGAFSVGKLQVSITNSDDAVLAVSDRLLAEEDKAIIFEADALLANDENPDGEVLTITSIDTSTITDGKLTLLADGRIEYLPNANTHGVQRFSYTVSDESGNESVGQVELLVEEVNDTPTVQAMHESMNEDETISFTTAELLSFASDVEDDWIRVEGIRSDYGHVNLDTYTGIASFTPKANFNSDLHGGDAKVEILFADERFGETWAPMLVHVIPVNDKPIAGDDVLFAWETGALDYVNPVRADWLFANDIEVDGETLRLHDISLPPSYGEILWDSSDPGSNDVIGYKADAGFIGADEFEYVVHDGAIHTDGELSLDKATVKIQVEDNHAPIATDFATIAAEDEDLLFRIDDFMANVFDQDLGHAQLPEVHKIVDVDEANALNGEVILNADGTVTFKPDQDYNSVQHGGVAQFSYTVQDIVGNTSTADVSITYTPVNDEPTTVPKKLGSIDEDSGGLVFSIEELLKGDYDVDGDAIGLEDIKATKGRLYLVDDDHFGFIPSPNANGNASIKYKVTDGELSTNGVATIYIRPVNDPPYTTNIGSVRGGDDRTYSIGGILKPSISGDIDGDAIHLEVVGRHGSVTNAYVSGGNINYGGNAGSGRIDYRVVDSHGAKSEVASVNVWIDHVNTAPTITSIGLPSIIIRDFGTRRDGQSVGTTITRKIQAEDAEGDKLTYYGSGDGVTVNSFTGDLSVEFGFALGSNSGPRVLTKKTTVTIRVIDDEGLFTTTTQTILFNGFVKVIDASPNKPIVFDLNNNGLTLLAASEGAARYDFDNDGSREATGWIAGEGDGLLAYDYDEDGVIKNHDEISFVSYLEGAQTDLEGLRAFDSNGDGRFGVGDARWGKFGVWIDDGDGLSEAGEFVTLDSLGIVSINLTSDGNQQMLNGNVIYGMTDVTLEDGSVIQAGDVGFQTLLEAPLAGLEQSLSFDPLETDEQESEEAESVLGEDSETDEETQSESSDETINAVEDEQQAQADAESDGIEDESSESSQQASDAMNDEAVDTSVDDQLNDSADSTTTEEQQASTNEADDNSQEDSGWQWPTDEELDQIALHDNHMAAAIPPTDSVPPSDTNPDAVPPPPMPKSEEEEVTSIF